MHFPRRKRRKHGLGACRFTGAIKVFAGCIPLPRTGVVHLKEHGDLPIDKRITQATIRKWAATGAAAVHCPSSDLRRRSGVAPLAALPDRSITLGAGLDGHGLGNDQDDLRELRLAWTLANTPSARAATGSAQTLLHMGRRRSRHLRPGESLGRSTHRAPVPTLSCSIGAPCAASGSQHRRI